MEDCFILIKENDQNTLEKVLMDLSNLYSETGFTNPISLYRKKGDTTSFAVTFSNDTDFDRFGYFLNYIKFPISYPDFKPILRGYFSTYHKSCPQSLRIGESIMIFISEEDTEYDNVYIATENNENHKIDFGGGQKKLVTMRKKYTVRQLSLGNYHHIIDIVPAKESDIPKQSPWWKIW